MNARGVSAGAAGVVAVVSGVLAAVASLDALALLSAAAGALAAGLAIDLARNPAEPVFDTEDTASSFTLVDEQTGLFVEPYFDATVDARVATARRVLRPLSIGFVEFVDLDADGGASSTPLAEIRDAVLATLREADMAFVVHRHLIGLVLEDTPEDGALWTVERIRRAVGTDGRGRRLWAGLASYPTHGLTAEDLRHQADEALRRAREWPQDRIEVADS